MRLAVGSERIEGYDLENTPDVSRHTRTGFIATLQGADLETCTAIEERDEIDVGNVACTTNVELPNFLSVVRAE